MIALLGLVALGIVIAVPVLIVAVSRFKRQLDSISSRITHLEHFNDELKQRIAENKTGKKTRPKKTTPAKALKSSPVKKVSTPRLPPATKDKKGADWADDDTGHQEKTPAQTAWQADTQQSSIEENLASKWFVWIGAAAIALAGVFLVKYIVDQGILTPAIRMGMAFNMGAALTAGGEWLRRRPMNKMIAAVKPDYVPLALTASGLFTMYGAVYGAYALYDLLAPLVTFAILAVVCLLAFGLSILQGPFVALIGLAGGLITPALIPADAPSAIGLFGFLAMVITACAGVLHFRPWPWLGFIASIGAGLWVLVWNTRFFQPGDSIAMTLFLAGLAVVFTPLLTRQKRQQVGEAMIDPIHPAQSVVYLAIAVSVLGMLRILDRANFTNTAISMLVVLVFVLTALAVTRPKVDRSILAALTLVVVAFGVRASHNDMTVAFDGTSYPVAARFVSWALGFAAVMAVVGFYFHRQTTTAVYWLAYSIITPLALLIISYFATYGVYSDKHWAAAAMALAMAALLACVLISRGWGAKQSKLPLGLYAIGVVAGVSLVFAFLLRDAWLTVALALQLPAIAWISNKLELSQLRKIAMVIAATLLVRLALNPVLLTYAKSHLLGQHWVLYGYGIPAIASHFAAQWFRQTKDNYLVTMLEGLRIVFVILLITAEIRILVHGSLASLSFNLLESSLQSIAWLAVAWSRLRSYENAGRRMDKWSGIVLFLMGVAMTFLVSLILHNPAVHYGENIGRWPVFNTLWLAYVIPAVLMWLTTRLSMNWLPAKNTWKMTFGSGVLVLLFAYVTLETRHLFQGPVLETRTTSFAEVYSYSLVWLIFAFVFLLYGLLKKRPVARYAALLVLIITVLKVFLSDMGGLQGLWRVASFLGLGLSLVGIGYLYQRFLYLPKAMANKPVAKDG
jgi:uncharacterized membrane protein